MPNTLDINIDKIPAMVHDILRQLYNDDFKPDYVVGLTRGGLMPALYISHYLNIPMHTLNVSLRDSDVQESNCWMAEDAFGYVNEAERELTHSRWDNKKRKKILIVDDINDSGATLEWIKMDWQQSCLPQETIAWDSVWNNNVKFAVLVDNLSSNFTVNYSSMQINKAENDVWINFPWENWWLK